MAAFIRCHGSIKQMERWFGVSYPTIKNRLRRISEVLPLAQHLTNDEDAARDAGADSARAAAPDQLAADAPDSPLQRLAQGEITVVEAAAALRSRR